MNDNDQSPIERETFAVTKIHWPDHFVDLLGKYPDAEVAKRMAVHLTTVQEERRRRGIEPFAPRRERIEWTDDMIALLGQAIDRDVAEELGISEKSVGYKRRNLGIPPFGPSNERRNNFWTKDRIARLGTRSDGELAKEWGLNGRVVAYRRNVLGIPPHTPPNARVDWTDEMRSKLGKVPDGKLAVHLGIGVHSVERERKRLGIGPAGGDSRKIVRSARLRAVLRQDTEALANEANVSTGTIHRLRAELDVPPPSKDAHWTPEQLAKLGQVPDAVLAKEMGLKTATVRKKRCRLGRQKRPFRRWTDQEDQLVISRPPAEAAALTGRTLKAVRNRRRYLGLKPPSRWTEERVAMLGSMNDTAVARKLGITSTAVRAQRKKRGIPAAPFSPRNWTSEEERIILQLEPEDASQFVGRSVRAVKRRRRKLANLKSQESSDRHDESSDRHDESSDRHDESSDRHDESSDRHDESSDRHDESSDRHDESS